jgi:hypothetical protein
MTGSRQSSASLITDPIDEWFRAFEEAFFRQF